MVINIKKEIFNVKVLITDKDNEIGMMFRKFDDNFQGLLFIKELGHHCFWMKNCIIPLDIIFIKNNVITKIHHNCPPCILDDCPNYCGEGDMVLELYGGTCKKLKISEKDSLSF